MISRRHFLAGSSSLLVSVPAVVRATSLMRCRGLCLPIERYHFGFVCRLYVSHRFPVIAALKAKGLTAHDIASRLSHDRIGAINGWPWDADLVMGVIRQHELIRRQDEIARQEPAL